jgi:serine/threonine-protein kinase
MPGQTFLNRYEVVQVLGEGGMGRVFLARQTDVGRPVVVKVMHAEVAADARFRQHFRREAQVLARFHHPHAVALYDAAIDDPTQPCLVMEYVPGITLEQLARRHGRLAPHRVGRLLGQLCSVLEAAHAAGILHRDLTAVNMMVVDADTPNEKLKVMDFGLARRGGGGPYFALGKLTGRDQGVGGTPDYLCPEQIRDEEVDHRGDLYSVGVLLFRLLTGRLPFEESRSVEEILRAQVERKPPTFAAVGAGSVATPAVESLVRTCLAKFPQERPQTARELAERFEKALGCKILPKEVITPPAPPSLRFRPSELVDYVEAWMPEAIALVKLRGFVEDLGGEVLGSEPGLVTVRLPGAPIESPMKQSSGLLRRLGLGKPEPPANTAILELHFEMMEGSSNHLGISVVMHPEHSHQRIAPKAWKEWCGRIARELRAYLMGK